MFVKTSELPFWSVLIDFFVNFCCIYSGYSKHESKMAPSILTNPLMLADAIIEEKNSFEQFSNKNTSGSKLSDQTKSTQKSIVSIWIDTETKKESLIRFMFNGNICKFLNIFFYYYFVQQTPNFQVKFKQDIVWTNVIIFAALHASALYGLYLLCIHEANPLTFIMCE